ncbi:calmodulin-binding transcription activator 3-like isoform X2 [Impatiens glandulifera]|uniref:calmodulin-binding transcription activator 3-like isoform X2 n=1 Tax=Impatiens glandulifera TaxID=253017 RepID=UPI001FB16A9D|nr:calmodulin-binding transcription activator 3-like isoform X2 [Impatiens glandulifera]
MAETRRYGLGTQLDIEQILLEAQHRWLRPAEICEILQNYQKFHIAPEPPQRPPNGSLFLFDRKVLRYFRKDGHNWRKKKDGKTVKEAHERLKAGSIDVLHCYYAHGEDNENFQRRSYWLLEEERSNIVLVHYREVKGSRANFNRVRESGVVIPDPQENEETLLQSEVNSSSSSHFHPYHQGTSQTTDSSLNSAQTSEYEDVESAYAAQINSGFQSFPERKTPAMENIGTGASAPYYPVTLPGNPSAANFFRVTGDANKISIDSTSAFGSQSQHAPPSWKVLENNQFHPSTSSHQGNMVGFNSVAGNELIGQRLNDGSVKNQGIGTYLPVQQGWQTSDVSLEVSNWPMDLRVNHHSTYSMDKHVDSFGFSASRDVDHLDSSKIYAHNIPQMQLRSVEGGDALKQEQGIYTTYGKADYSSLRQPQLDGLQNEGLKKLDSFDRWMSKELGDVNESHMTSNTGVLWDAVAVEDVVDDSSIASQVHLDNYVLSPSISQDQFFSIRDFSPTWAYAGSKIKVLIMGRFLKSWQDLQKCKWSCMFGEIEVPAQVLQDGVLCCITPVQKAGTIPFYVTCSNRSACSEVREFEYRDYYSQDVEIPDVNSKEVLHMRFEKLLSIDSTSSQSSSLSSAVDYSFLSNKINSLMKASNEWEQFLNNSEEISPELKNEQLLQKFMKERLHVWLLQKVAEGGKGPSVWDRDGQGILHFAAALGYDWAIAPTVDAGVSINFRDVNGWTALHWAAYCGRERTVGLLISLDADPGKVTDPTPIYTGGRTPADLASSNGHKGIAGYLAESSLSSHLSHLQLDTRTDAGETSVGSAVRLVSERTAIPITDGDFSQGTAMKDSLEAVRNATQAAARIHQVYRVQSFQRKQKEYDNEDLAMSVVSGRKSRLGQNDEPVQVAAVRIQNKFRSWKGRREYLTIRQQIVKIQAHVRGYQVRKNYRKITWSVGILEKVILRWRRKGSGLRGFKPETINNTHSDAVVSSKEDDYDFLKEGRKQTEERLQKALARVKSMVQYPEARDQYRRLLNVVSEMQETKAVYDRVLNSTEDSGDFDDLVDIEALLYDDDDTFMPTTTY